MDATETTAGNGAPGLQAGFHFADAVIARSRTLGHCFCLGLDPHLAMIPAAFRRGTMDAREPETAHGGRGFPHRRHRYRRATGRRGQTAERHV